MILRIAVLSDLHNEHAMFSPADVDADVVILAGDIDLGTKGIEWAHETFPCPVIYVAGNHEFYHGHLTSTLKSMKRAGYGNVHVLEKGEAVIDGVRFLGATGWTDYKSTGSAPLAEMKAMSCIADFDFILTGTNYRKTRPDDFARIATKTKIWLQEKLVEPFNGRTVVVTHHGPSTRSLQGNPHPRSHVDAAFVNAWEDLFVDGPVLWVHGHSHFAVDYEMGGTRVLSNPRGYPGERTGFDAGLVVEV